MTPDDGDLIRNNLVLNSLLHAPTPCGKVKQIAQNECAAFTCACASELENCLLADAQTLSPVKKYPARAQLSPLWWESLYCPYLRINKRNHFCGTGSPRSRKVKMGTIKSHVVLVQNVGDLQVGFLFFPHSNEKFQANSNLLNYLFVLRLGKKKKITVPRACDA